MLLSTVKRYMKDPVRIRNSGEVLYKRKARDYSSTSLSTYDFSTLYTTLPHILNKDKLFDLIEKNLQ